MIVFSKRPQEEDIFKFASDWLDTLASNLDAAWRSLYHPEEEELTLELFRGLIQTYEDLDLLPEAPYQVTPASDTDKKNSICVDCSEDGGGVAINIPLNGEVSDLIAELAITRVSDGYCYRMRDLHVM